jgi:hypothetical protein
MSLAFLLLRQGNTVDRLPKPYVCLIPLSVNKWHVDVKDTKEEYILSS